MNANFDSEKTPDRDRPTAHRHAYRYSIYLDTDSRCGVAKGESEGLALRGISRRDVACRVSDRRPRQGR